MKKQPAAEVLLYVVRHGTTALNSANRFRGHEDVPLDRNGYKEAEALAHYFSAIPLAAIVHADLKRAKATAIAIQQYHKMHRLPLEVDPALRAWDFGDFSGKRKSRVRLRQLGDFVDHPRKKLPGGESLKQFQQRVQPVLRAAIEAGKEADQPILLVTSSSVIHELGQMINGDAKSTLVEPGGCAVVGRIGDVLLAAPLLKPDLSGDKPEGPIS